jgi:hypothetical protein
VTGPGARHPGPSARYGDLETGTGIPVARTRATAEGRVGARAEHDARAVCDGVIIRAGGCGHVGSASVAITGGTTPWLETRARR